MKFLGKKSLKTSRSLVSLILTPRSSKANLSSFPMHSHPPASCCKIGNLRKMSFPRVSPENISVPNQIAAMDCFRAIISPSRSTWVDLQPIATPWNSWKGSLLEGIVKLIPGRSASLNELPLYSRWPARLLGIEPFERKIKNETELNREYELEQWTSLA